MDHNKEPLITWSDLGDFKKDEAGRTKVLNLDAYLKWKGIKLNTSQRVYLALVQSAVELDCDAKKGTPHLDALLLASPFLVGILGGMK